MCVDKRRGVDEKSQMKIKNNFVISDLIMSGGTLSIRNSGPGNTGSSGINPKANPLTGTHVRLRNDATICCVTRIAFTGNSFQSFSHWYRWTAKELLRASI